MTDEFLTSNRMEYNKRWLDTKRKLEIKATSRQLLSIQEEIANDERFSV